MKKKVLFIVLALFIVNIIWTSLILSTISSIQVPNVTIDIKAVSLNEHTVTIEANLFINNPNSFSFVFEDIFIDLSTPEGIPIGTIALPNTTIASGENKTIFSVSSIGFNNSTLTSFHSQITGIIRVTLFGFFPKSLPLNVLFIANPTALIEAVQIPSISFDANFSEFTTEGLLFNGTIWVENQNDFSLLLSDSEISISHTEAINVADFTASDIFIPPKSIVPIFIDGTANYSIFNQGKLSAAILGNISVLVAGINMSLPISLTASVDVPDLSAFLFQDQHLIISISADVDITLKGLNATVGLSLYNPTSIPLTAVNLTLFMYRLDNSTPTILGKDTLEQCVIPPENDTYLESHFLLPYSALLPKRNSGFPEWFQLSLSADLTIADTTQQIPIIINAYVSPKLFKFT